MSEKLKKKSKLLQQQYEFGSSLRQSKNVSLNESDILHQSPPTYMQNIHSQSQKFSIQQKDNPESDHKPQTENAKKRDMKNQRYKNQNNQGDTSFSSLFMKDSENIELDLQNNYMSNITFQSPQKRVTQNEDLSQDIDLNQRVSLNEDLQPEEKNQKNLDKIPKLSLLDQQLTKKEKKDSKNLQLKISFDQKSQPLFSNEMKKVEQSNVKTQREILLGEFDYFGENYQPSSGAKQDSMVFMMAQDDVDESNKQLISVRELSVENSSDDQKRKKKKSTNVTFQNSLNNSGKILLKKESEKKIDIPINDKKEENISLRAQQKLQIYLNLRKQALQNEKLDELSQQQQPTAKKDNNEKVIFKQVFKQDKLTRENYDKAMEQIWSGQGGATLITEADYEMQLYEKAKQKINSFKPYRQIIQEIIQADINKDQKEVQVKNKIFREEEKRKLSGKDVWNPGPKDFKGGKLNWVENKVRDEIFKKVYQNQEDLSKENKVQDYKANVKNFMFKRLLKLKKQASSIDKSEDQQQLSAKDSLNKKYYQIFDQSKISLQSEPISNQN